MRPHRIKKDPCAMCNGTGIIKAHLGIRPKSISWPCGECNGTGKGRLQRMVSHPAVDGHG